MYFDYDTDYKISHLRSYRIVFYNQFKKSILLQDNKMNCIYKKTGQTPSIREQDIKGILYDNLLLQMGILTAQYQCYILKNLICQTIVSTSYSFTKVIIQYNYYLNIR